MQSSQDSLLEMQPTLQLLGTCDVLRLYEGTVESLARPLVVSDGPRPHLNRDARQPSQFPDLGDIPTGSLRASLMTQALVADLAVHDESRYSYLLDLVRLAEKALWSYNAARAHFTRLIEEHSVVNAMGCTDRLEDCIDATYRGYLVANVVLSEHLEGESLPAVDDAVTVELSKVKSRRKSLRQLREAIRDHDERMRHVPRHTSDTTPLSFDEAQILVGTRSLRYLDLERLVRTLHEITTAILQA
jgi:hypothetical protein